jgi:hypothetical protein
MATFNESTGKLTLTKAQTACLERAALITKVLAKHADDYPTAKAASEALNAIVNPPAPPAAK